MYLLGPCRNLTKSAINMDNILQYDIYFIRRDVCAVATSQIMATNATATNALESDNRGPVASHCFHAFSLYYIYT